MRIRNHEGYEKLSALVNEIVEVAVEETGWEWLDLAVEPASRRTLLDQTRALVRNIRRTEPENSSVSARKRWVEMAFDAAVQRLQREREEDELLEDDLIDY